MRSGAVEKVYAVIMAGGRGERFWPLSSDAHTKPFIPLLGRSSLIQDTVERLLPLLSPERILVSIGSIHETLARQQLPGLPEENFIIEPIARDTAACLGLCALHLELRDPEAVMLALPADQFVDRADGYVKTLRKGIESLEGSTAVVFGIVPDRADTSYGYIRAEKPAVSADFWPVLRFVEKPDPAQARRYFESGQYFWNSGMFLWRVRTLLELFELHMPAMSRDLRRIRELLRRPESGGDLERIFSGLERISIDFAIAEKARGLRLVPADFYWDDIGNWASLARALPCDSSGNVSVGEHFPVDTQGCVVFSDSGGIATYGVSDLVVVQANGRVLVCPKNRSTELKRLVSSITKGVG